MPRRRIPVRKIKEALRLKFTCGLTDRQVACSIGVARSTAAEYFRRFTASGLPYPLPQNVDDASLTARLFPPPRPCRLLCPALCPILEPRNGNSAKRE